MNTKSTHSDESFEAVLADYLQAVARGEQVDRDTFLKNHPTWATELKEFFDNHDRVCRMANDRRSIEDSHSGTSSPVSGSAVPGRRPISSGLSLTLDSAESSPRGERNEGESTPQPTAGRPLRRFGDYEILEEISRGGMGIVYKARQTTLNRIVAIKMILSGRMADEKDIRRFRVEAESAANLQHPHIVGIYEVGQQEGQHYFSMEYVAGKSLAELVESGPLPPKQAALYVREVAEAMEFAHQRGVLGSLGFVMMGSSYWGYCYVIGACFLALAMLMPLNPPLAPLAFGLAWGASLLALARHLGKLARFSL